MYDVIIIGCGITGAAAAFHLSKYKLSICVLEGANDVSCGTTKANSAILHAGYDPEPGTLMARLNVRGAELAAQLCGALDVPYRRCGSFVAAFTEEDEHTLQTLLRRGQANGVSGLEILTGEEARSLEPNLSPEVRAVLHAPTAAICSPWEYCLALAETAVVNGADLKLEHAVTGLERMEQGWRVHTTCGDVEGRFVLNAAGLGAQAIHEMAAPRDFVLRPSRGQYYLLDKSEGDRVGRVIFQCPGPLGKGVLVTPTVHGNLMAGPNAEPVEGDDTATTAAGLDFVRRTAARSVPSVAFGAVIRTFAGVRSATDRGDFIIQQAAPGFFDLAGICSPGLTAAPAIAEYAAGLLSDAGLELNEKPDFVCSRKRIRFKELPPAEKAALVAARPEYGRIVCRCETVTEGEILDCFRRPIPPRSLDGVKRRVGAGLGRCQGGFCGPRVAELLDRELGLGGKRLLQENAGSWLLAEETKGGHSHV